MLIAFCGGTQEQLIKTRNSLHGYCTKKGLSVNISLFENWRDVLPKASEFKMICIKNSAWDEAFPIVEKAILSSGLGKSKKAIILNNFTYPLTESALNQMYRCLVTYFASLEIPVKDGLKHIPTKEIIYFENISRKVYVHTKNGSFETLLSMKTARKMTEGLGFFSPHISFIVNLAQVENVKGYDVKLKVGCIIPVSQKRSSTFRKEYKQYLNNINVQ